MVLYNPVQEDVVNVERIADYFDQLVVVDNSPKSSSVCAQEWTKLEAVSICRNYNKGGIAGAFNRALENLTDDPDLVILLDQDSRITLECVDQLVQSAEEIGDEPFVLGPAVFDVNLEKYSVLLNLETWRYRTKRPEDLPPGRHSVFSTISSGSVISRKARKILGGFDEELFIDHVDTEYALRARKRGVPFFIDTRATLKHAIGQRTEYKLLGVSFRPNNHNSARRYYIFRNGLILGIRYFYACPAFFLLNCARMIHELLCVILYEGKRCRKIVAIMLGVWDGLRLKVGAFSDRWPKLSKKL
ncbi:glycosyltransferase [Ralstonia sp. Ralssp110]|uniref:glycosyltransferase n=1 Tax=Ralstonia sp. Ralssp110 TaxID=3243004 RepID=UPI0039B56D14